MLRWKFVKFLLSILKRQVDSSPNFVYLCSFTKITPLYFFNSTNIYFAQEEHIKTKLFEAFKCSGQNSSNSSCQFWYDKSIPLQILHHFSLLWHVTPLWILSSYFFYFGLKDSIKIPILRLSSALVKVCQIRHVIFQTTSQFFFIFFITLQCNGR